MNQYVEKWIKALRSGEYEQGIGALCKDGEYCCLGVACEIFKKELKLTVQTIAAGTQKTYNDHGGSLPYAVKDVLNLSDDYGSFYGNSLDNLNDIEGKTFAEIADIIESKPKGLFRD
jgi:hypothetical protein